MHDSTDEHLLKRILEDNDQLAHANRHSFEHAGAFAVNFMSAPGAGKTTLISKLANELRSERSIGVIEGDMVGDIDAQRLRDAGINAVQISTGRSCHLDAKMISRLIDSNKSPAGDLIIIENVGNLVCPAEFPLGEHLRIVLLSVTEGDDKPLKYPVIFRNCDAVVITKMDLAELVDFDFARLHKAISSLNSKAELFKVSAKSGEGIEGFCSWLNDKCAMSLKAAEATAHSHSH
ncbi:hydrogenase nickel incorporation protein HypB [Candidatus Obscuribacterales bacterium]|nr:hydrogenase nickel incorporation protein HypB [Candidatus Obscuribacterales bacterium]